MVSDEVELLRVPGALAMPVGSGRCIAAGEKRIALFRTEDGFFALDDTCPHRGGSLSEGDLIDGEVVCPWHFWPFDLATGTHQPSGGRFRVAAYPTRTEGDDIVIEITQDPLR